MRSFLALAVLLSSAAAAHAECNWLRWVGQPPNVPLPAHGTLYYDDERTDAPADIHFDGGTGHVTQTRIDDRITRVDYTAAPDSKLVLQGTSDPVSYPIVATVHYRQPRIVSYWHYEYSWSCSSGDALMIQVDQPLAAVHAAWTRGEVTEHYLVVPRTDEGKVVIELGKVDCGSTTIDPDELRLGGHLELVGIRADGSEAVLTGLPEQISTDDLATDDSGLAYAMTFAAVEEPEEPAPPPPHKPDPGNTTGAIVLGIVALTMFLGWRFGLRGPSGPGSAASLEHEQLAERVVLARADTASCRACGSRRATRGATGTSSPAPRRCRAARAPTRRTRASPRSRSPGRASRPRCRSRPRRCRRSGWPWNTTLPTTRGWSSREHERVAPQPRRRARRGSRRASTGTRARRDRRSATSSGNARADQQRLGARALVVRRARASIISSVIGTSRRRAVTSAGIVRAPRAPRRRSARSRSGPFADQAVAHVDVEQQAARCTDRAPTLATRADERARPSSIVGGIGSFARSSSAPPRSVR